MLLRRDASSDITIVRIKTLTVTSSLSLDVSYLDVTLTVTQTALTQDALTQAVVTQYVSSTSLAQSSLLATDTLSLPSLSEDLTSSTVALSLASTTHSAISTSSASWESYSSSLDTNLGLAIGIPMAVVALVAVLCIGWIIFRKMRSRLRDVLTVEKEKSEWRPPSDGSTTLGWVPQPEPPKRTLLNRLSRIMDWPASPASFCPPILRRFHLLAPTELPVPPTPPEKPSATRVVVRPYTKRLGDELSIVTGQTVQLHKNHLDGWALVSLDGEEGVVPMACLKRP